MLLESTWLKKNMGCIPSKLSGIEDRLNTELKLSKRDLTAAIRLSRKHNELKNYFRRCLDLMMTLPDDSKIEVSLENISVLLKPSGTSITLDKMRFVADFFALIGGAKSTVKLYTDTLEHVVTKEMFEDEIYEESNYYYEEGYDEENYLEYYEENENAEDEMEAETTEAENVEEVEETSLETERENEDDENRHADVEAERLENEEDTYRETEKEPNEVETEAESYVENEYQHEENDGVQETNEGNTELEYEQQANENDIAEETEEENKEETTEEGTEHVHEEDNQDDDKREDESRRKAMETIQCLRSFWTEATDISLNFQARLATAGLFHFLAEDITKLQSSSEEEDLKVFNECLEILHNCAQNPDLRRHFQKINAVELLMTFIESENRSIKMTSLLTLSYLVDEEQNKQLVAEDKDWHTLLDVMETALDDKDHRCCVDEYNHSLLELLKGVLNLTQNDDIKKALMKTEIHLLLKRVLEEGTEDEMKVAINILWQLCFIDSNKRKIEKDPKLMELLQEKKGHKVKTIARGAAGILQLIEMKVQKGVKTSKTVTPTSGHVMISYNWGSKETALKIRKLLGKKQYKVWIDVEQMKGDILDSMATAVEESAVVLMFVSYQYKKSANCRMEATYALSANKPIIPLMMESDYKGDGWLKLMISSKLYFDFSGKKDFNDVFDNLIKELGERGKEAKTPEKSADKS